MTASNTTKAFTHHHKGISTYNSAMFNTTEKNMDPISDAHAYRSSHNASALDHKLPSLQPNQLIVNSSMSLKSRKAQLRLNRQELSKVSQTRMKE